MERIRFENLERLSGFDVDLRPVYRKSSDISMLSLKSGEEYSQKKCDFQIHVAFLSGEVEMSFENRVEKFKTGCLVSILPSREVKMRALEDSRILIIRDDPLWVLRERRSVRKFSKIPVPKRSIEKIVEISLLAPSAGNLQPWKIYAIADQRKKDDLARASYDQEHVSQAPWVLVVTAVPSVSESEYGERGRKLYSIQDTAALVTYITLAAKAYNLDTCWVGAFKDEEVWRIIGSPEGEVPVAIVPIGYGEESPEIPDRKPLKEVLEFI